MLRFFSVLVMFPLIMGCGGGNEPAKIPDKQIPIIKDGPTVGGTGKEKTKPPPATEK
ncbi:MAG: hypothetical protein SNJ75_12065 [Gemmataceae bacterium]